MEEKQLREFIKSQLNDIISEGRKIRQETPNEFWYLDFKKWAYKKRGKIKKELIEIKNTNRPGGSTGQMFQRMESYWIEWANKNNKEATFIDNINAGGKFGRALILMMIDDNLVFKMDGNKMTGIIGESNVNEAYKKDGHRYEIEEVGHTSGTDRGGIEMDKAFVGKDGMLGENGVYISWNDIKRLMKKYS